MSSSDLREIGRQLRRLAESEFWPLDDDAAGVLVLSAFEYGAFTGVHYVGLRELINPRLPDFQPRVSAKTDFWQKGPVFWRVAIWLGAHCSELPVLLPAFDEIPEPTVGADIEGTRAWYRAVASAIEAEAGRLEQEAGPDRFNSGNAPVDDRQTTGGRKRRRATKRDTELKTYAAVMYKMEHPGASRRAVANEVKMPRQTLERQPLWQEWEVKIERAVADGQLEALKQEFDGRIGLFVAGKPDPPKKRLP